MRAIQLKVVRNLWQLKGQVLAIALVITVGVAMFITYFSTFDSLTRPARCPGVLMSSGIAAMSTNEPRRGRRNGTPGRKEPPWSAVTTTTASS